MPSDVLGFDSSDYKVVAPKSVHCLLAGGNGRDATRSHANSLCNSSFDPLRAMAKRPLLVFPASVVHDFIEYFLVLIASSAPASTAS